MSESGAKRENAIENVPSPEKEITSTERTREQLKEFEAAVVAQTQAESTSSTTRTENLRSSLDLTQEEQTHLEEQTRALEVSQQELFDIISQTDGSNEILKDSPSNAIDNGSFEGSTCKDEIFEGSTRKDAGGEVLEGPTR